MSKKVLMVAVVLVFCAGVLPVGAAVPASIELSAVCDLAHEEIVLAWSTDNDALAWTVTRNEQIIATVPSQYPAADVVYSYHDSGSGGEYTVSGGGETAAITINCAMRKVSYR